MKLKQQGKDSPHGSPDMQGTREDTWLLSRLPPTETGGGHREMGSEEQTILRGTSRVPQDAKRPCVNVTQPQVSWPRPRASTTHATHPPSFHTQQCCDGTGAPCERMSLLLSWRPEAARAMGRPILAVVNRSQVCAQRPRERPGPTEADSSPSQVR